MPYVYNVYNMDYVVKYIVITELILLYSQFIYVRIIESQVGICEFGTYWTLIWNLHLDGSKSYIANCWCYFS